LGSATSFLAGFELAFFAGGPDNNQEWLMRGMGLSCARCADLNLEFVVCCVCDPASMISCHRICTALNGMT